MPHESLRILILEDVPMDAELIEYELRKASFAFESRRVDNRESFEHGLRDFHPDIVLSDYTLPQFDGMLALDSARAWAPTLPFIIVTGSINEETAVRCMKAGATDYLLKNNLARIGPAIEAALELERTRGERIRAEGALRRSEANLRAIFDSTIQAFILVDLGGRIRMVNATATTYAEELTGRPIREGDPLPAFALAGDGFHQARAGQRVVEERVITDRHGAERLYETAYTPVIDEDRVVIGVSLSAIEVSERRRVEERLRQAERMQATGKLAGGVAHEVNNMMTAVIGFGDFLLRALGPDDPRHLEVVEILRAAHRASDVTRQLLAFSRQQFLQPRVLDPNTVVAEMAPILRRSLGEDKELQLRLTPNVGCVRADASQLEQVLLNLVINARDAMQAGGVVTIETELATLDPAYAAQHAGLHLPVGQYVMIVVSDTGHGMDAKTLARIFEPFFTTKPVGQGTGLGLSTAYGIIKQSNGFIWAYSEPGHGTAFKVYLPYTAAPEDVPLAPAEPSPAGGSETILVVEDEQVVRDLACRALRGFGYTVLEARHGVEALALVERNGTALHLVVSDVVMPEMGGRELGVRLAAARPGLPVLYMSGYTGEDVIERGLLAEGSPLHSKPFTPDGLAAKVREMLDGR